MRRGKSNSLRRKRNRFKRELKSTAKSTLSFVPGLGLALSTYDTSRKAIKTAHATRDYGNALYEEAKRKINKYNPFY